MQIKRRPRHGTTVGVFCIGGLLYTLIEIGWRGHSHWSMFLLGGVCFRVIGSIHERFARRSLWLRCGLCAGAITLLEFLCGWIVNLRWELHVWDYSHMPLNIKGQVCLLYSFLWGLLSLIACPVYRLVTTGLTYRRRCLKSSRWAMLPQRAFPTARGTRRTNIPTK